MTNLWPILSLAANLLLALLLYSLRSTIRIAILELKDELTARYASKEDLTRVEQKVDLSKQMKDGFNEVMHMIRLRGANVNTTPPGGFVER
jgi:hypothetical protein